MSGVFFVVFKNGIRKRDARVLPYKTWIFTDKEWINGADFF